MDQWLFGWEVLSNAVCLSGRLSSLGAWSRSEEGGFRAGGCLKVLSAAWNSWTLSKCYPGLPGL